MSKGFAGFLSFVVANLSSMRKYKACEQCPYWSMECNVEKHCQSRFQVDGVVWHLGKNIE